MAARSRSWFFAAVAFTVINVLGALWALSNGEWPHALTHVGLVPVGVFAMYWSAGRRRASGGQSGDPTLDARLLDLQRAVDAIALEVERVGEAQRFITRKAAEQAHVARDPGT